jgi:hypothetical protein
MLSSLVGLEVEIDGNAACEGAIALAQLLTSFYEATEFTIKP